MVTVFGARAPLLSDSSDSLSRETLTDIPQRDAHAGASVPADHWNVELLARIDAWRCVGLNGQLVPWVHSSSSKPALNTKAGSTRRAAAGMVT
jgi:hypothetical protein